ncbi:hypothetical protein TVAG_282700 [Trichomonas vaginalis G3]|uniref:DUF3447 domain-containing protein n=1 Tax=Trichomonas vaginalis (strain ATCC PRA-98 / G3) TaxID=412133 RepID=A2DEH3_TRIV3|nr:spectrin binding [Trichomonas vaginalis G3]EAY21100.1 hypothetical protein TVAG_282700 [Trichomonas vaginalis G3]KAI5539971.1 spectrin binding [Trichomonas vaginalis G3]|eukprot:XP_001582086.1 hypothetical protein [Trichomonas vaginalis G3]
MNEYKGYIDTWDAIYKLDTNEIDSTAGLYEEIKNNLIDTGYYTAIEMIYMLTVIGQTSFHYPHAYLELINRIYEEYHIVEDYLIPVMTKKLEIKINTPEYAILYDNADKLLYHLKSGKLDLSELLEKCCLRGAINCFKLLRKEFDVEISKGCLDYSFKGSNQYIIQECLKVQKPDETTMIAAISSHNINNFLHLFNEYEFYDWIYRAADFENLHAFIIYLNATNNVNECFVLSPKFHIPALCEYLIANGADINYWGPNGITALDNAIIANQTKIASVLILNKISIVETYLKKAIKK